MARLKLAFPEHHDCYSTELTMRAAGIDAFDRFGN